MGYEYGASSSPRSVSYGDQWMALSPSLATVTILELLTSAWHVNRPQTQKNRFSRDR
jgi:hypothetical protein